MATTYTLISSTTLGSNQASVVFSAIPQTYTDLTLLWSTRESAGGNSFGYTRVTFNGNSSGQYSRVYYWGDGSAVASNRVFSGTFFELQYTDVGSGGTASTFSNNSMYIPNYTLTTPRNIFDYGVVEANGAVSFITAFALLDNLNAPVSSITITGQNSFATNSSFYLYGIKNS